MDQNLLSSVEEDKIYADAEKQELNLNARSSRSGIRSISGAERPSLRMSLRSGSDRQSFRLSSAHDCDIAEVVQDFDKFKEESANPGLVLAPVVPQGTEKKPSFYSWATAFTEDGAGLFLALILFCFSVIVSGCKTDITESYASTSQWPVGATALSLFVMVAAHYILNKPMIIESYCSVLMIALVSRSIGNYTELTHAGLSASLWAILIGSCIRSAGFVLNKGVFSGEFFVKIGVTLMAMDFTTILGTGLPGLMVAWGDTVIVLTVGIFFCHRVMDFTLRDAIVVSGATCICGSSAATALSSSVHPKGYKDEVCKTIIAIMGVFNSPLMPLMPLVKTLGHVNPIVVGAWIGGSIDSTGQVTASAQMGGNTVLKTAIIIKMAQNILIGII
jgi:hypothetical protein